MVALVVVVSHSHLLSSLTHARKYLATLPLALSHTTNIRVRYIFTPACRGFGGVHRLYNGSVVLLDVIERGSGSKRCDSGSDSESTTRPARYLIEQTGVKVVHLAISYTNNQHLLLAGWATGQLCQWRIAPHHLQPSDTSAVPAPTTSTTPTTTPTPTPTPSLLQPPPLPPLRPVQDFGIVRTAPFDQPTLFEHDLRASSPFILASPLECSCNATTIDDWLDPSHREHHHSPWYSSSNDACTRGGNNDSGDSSSVMASSAVHRYKAALFECDSNPDTLACCVDRQNNEVVVWNVSDTSKSFNDGLRLGGYQSEIITLSVDYPWLVTGTLDGSSRVWDLVAIKHELRVSNAPDTTPSVHVFESALADLSLAPTNAGVPTAITANAGLTATGFHRGSVVVWALPNPLRAELLDDAPVPPIAILKPQSLAVRNVCITDDAELLISSTIDSSIRVCRIRTAERLYSIDIASGFPVQFVSPAFALVAATGPDLYLIDFAELPIDLPASAFPKPDGVDRLSLRWIDSTTSGTLDGSHSSYSSTSSDLTLSSIATIDDDLSGSGSNCSSSSCSDSSGSASDSEMPISADTTTIAHDHDSDDDLLLLPPASYTEHSLPKDHRYQVLPQPLASNMSTAASTTSSMAMMTTAVTTMATSLDSSSSSTSTSAESLPAPFTWSIEFINLIRSLMVDKQPRVPPCDHHHSSELSSIITEPAGCPFQNAGHFGAGGAGSSISLLNDDDDDEELDGATSSSSATNLVSVRTEFQSATGRVVYSVVVSASVVLLLVTLLLLGVFLYELIAEPYHGVGPLLFHTFTKAVYITSIVLQLTGVAVFSLFPCLAILMMVYFVLRLMWNRRRYRQRHELVVGHHARTFEI